MANVQLRSFGGLNTDSHIQDIRNGDYTDAKNIDHVSTADGESLAITPRVGNEFGFSLGEVTRQNKVYIFIPPAVFPEGGFVVSFLRTDQVTELIPDLIIQANNVNSIRSQVTQHFQTFNISVYLQDGGEFNPALSSYAGSFVVVPGQGSEIGFCYDYTIKSIGTNILDIQIAQEAISPSRTGQLEVTGSFDLSGDLFIISTPKRDKPFNINVLNILSIEGDVYVIPETQDFEHVNGIEIYITGIPSVPQVNGVFIAMFELQPSGLYWIRLFNTYIDPTTLVYQGGGVIKFNPLGIGEIGVAQKNESKNEWKYTRLLRSKELNLFTYHQCDTQGEESFNRKSIYYTDFNDVPRNFYYKIDTEYYTDGSIELFYPESGYYNYGSISRQTNHILGQPSLDIDFISQPQGGGSLYAGNHVYFSRGVLGDGSYTDWSLPSRNVPVYSPLNTSVAKNIIGDISGTQTGKQNQIRISNISGDVFDYIEVACINIIDIGSDATVYGIFAKVPVTRSTTEIFITHTGREIGQELNPDELSVQTEVYTKAKNNAIIDNRYLLSNLETPLDDLSNILEKATYSIKTKEISKPWYATTQIYGGHQDPFNVYYYSGYMLNETYRIGARIKYSNGYTSPVYKLFDVTIDAEQSSIDNRRLSGLSSYDLNTITDPTVNPRTGNPFPQNIAMLVPYIEINGPDLSSEVINGVPANLVIDRIEYFRAEVVNPSIVGSGYAVMHVKSLTTNTPYAPRYTAYVSSTNESSLYMTTQLPIATQDTSSPVYHSPMVSYEFPFILGNDQSQEPSPQLYDLPSNIRYYDSAFTINSGTRAGTDYGYQWNDKFASIYLADAFLNENFENLKVSSGDYVINLGQPSLVTGYYANTTRPSNRYNEFLSLNNTNKEVIKINESLFVPAGNPLKLSTDYVSKKIGIDRMNSVLIIEDATNLLMTDGTQRNLYNGIWGFFNVATGDPITSSGWNGGEGAQVEFVLFWNEYCTNGIICSPTGGTGLIFTSPTPDPTWNGYEFKMTLGSQEYIAKLESSVSTGDVLKYTFYDGYIVNLIDKLSSFTDLFFKRFDRGIRSIQIKRDIPENTQYSQEGLDKFVYTGSYQLPNSSDPVDIFGGDTFTTQLFVKTITQTSDLNAPMDGGMQQGILLNTQTKNNIYLIYKTDDIPLFPATYNNTNLLQNVLDWVSKKSLDSYFYNYGYSINNLGIAYRVGVTKDINKKLKTRVIWSDAKPQNARSDFYRRFGVLSYNDLDASFGEINSMKNVNGELFTIQVSKFQKQFFNTRGTLSVSDGSQVVLGDAGVFSRPGITISSYGCLNKWSVFLGRSAGGDDVPYWYDSINKKLMRFGSDGAVPISDRANIRTLTLNGLKWILDLDSPADNYGIHGVWNQRLNEATWTCRAHRAYDFPWTELTLVNPGDIVYLENEENFLNFERTIVLYVCIKQNGPTGGRDIIIEPGVTVGWENYYTRPSIDDLEYYSIKTITWSESKNRFISRDETPHPRIYLRWKDTYLSPRPAGSLNEIYEHNSGEYLQWYLNKTGSQTESGFVEVVFNIDPNTTKQFISLICNSEIVPSRVEAFTKNHSTVMTAGEFLEQLDQFVVPIPNNIQNGSTSEDNTFLYGQWIKVRFYFDPLQFQRLTNIVLKFNPMARLWNS